MPWTPADAPRHKRGLSARQRRQWAAVANTILATCLRRGGSQSTCEGRAIRGANSAVGDPELSTQTRLTIQTALTVPPQRLTLHNREYLTAPAVLIVEGVLNGGYIPAEALVPEDWNGVPIVINHPRDADGVPMSARSPEVLAAYGVGQVYRARRGTSQRQGQPVASLQAELWLDVTQATLLGGEAQQALTMLEAQHPLEVSTGFYAETAATIGSFFGTAYREVHHALRPDHLALLPTGIGACDWSAGCGAPRLNTACACQGEDRMEAETPRGWRSFVQMLRQIVHTADAELDVNQTDTDIREALYGALAREMGVDVTPLFLDSVNPDDQSFTYRQGERLRRRHWAMEDGVLTLLPDVEDVQRETTYISVPTAPSNPTSTQEGAPMATEAVLARVTALLAQPGSGWTEADRPQLEAMSDAQLTHLARLAQTAHAEATRVKTHITALMATGHCPFTEDRLSTFSEAELLGLLAVHGPSAATAPPGTATYLGQGLAQERGSAQDDAPPPPPKTLERVVALQQARAAR